MVTCPAVLIAGCASGQGKTTVTAGLARLFHRHGLRVRVFKVGPDFLDPMILARASGSTVHQLDLWMGGLEHCRALLYDAACNADLILIEGVMGLFDGTPSAADLAAAFGVPVLLAIDAAAMAQTFAALVHGLTSFRNDLSFAGVIANGVGSPGHRALLQESVAGRTAFLGSLPRQPEFSLPSRHLGLVAADELSDLEQKLDAVADALELHAPLPLPAPVVFSAPAPAAPPQAWLAGCRIAVARDAAFCFLYQANLDLLRSMGAELRFFSPLADPEIPDADALYLPGGYPELHLAQLEQNRPMLDAIRRHILQHRPTLAECGGLLILTDRLSDADGHSAAMAGILPGSAALQKKLVNLGLHSVTLPEGELRGHTFHYSLAEIDLTPLAQSVAVRAHSRSEAIYRVKHLTASYLHFYFPSNALAVARLFGAPHTLPKE